MTPEIPPDFFILLISLSILTQASPTRHPKENNTNNSTQNDSQGKLESREPILLSSYEVLARPKASPTKHPKENNTINSTQSSQNASQEELESKEPILLSSYEVLARPIDCPMLTPKCPPVRKGHIPQAPRIQRSIHTHPVQKSIDYNNL